MCVARRPPLVLTYSCLMLVALVVLSVAAKSMLDRLGVPQTNEQENSAGCQLLAEPAAQPASAAALALPFQGNLRPNALIPVVVQPRLINAAAYTAPHAGNGRGLSNPGPAELLRGRRSV